MTTPDKCPKLTELADHCLTGACNSYALITSFGERIAELKTHEVKDHPAVKVILGQLTSLCGESIGATHEAYQAYQVWRKTT